MAEIEDKQVKTWGMLCHLSALSAYIGIPMGHIIGPLVVWMMKKEEHPFIDEQGKEALNFQISMTIYLVGVIILCFLMVGFVLLPVWIVAHIALPIVATIKADKGESYRYPVTFRIIE